jgi:hypothetical protein
MLSTQRLLEEAEQPEYQGEVGWQGVGTGLRRILFGHLLSLGSVLGVVTLAVLLVPDKPVSHSFNQIDWVEIILLVACLVAVLAIMASYAMLLTGQWLCLMYAPERCGAKWMMFSAMTCLVAAPVLNITASFLVDQELARAHKKQDHSATGILRGVKEYPEAIQEPDIYGYLRLAGSGFGVLSSLFFILFLRSVARCFEDRTRVLLVDGYLGFVALLAAGTAYLFFGGQGLLADPVAVLGIAGGWVLALLYYLFLITSLGNCVLEERGRARSQPSVAQ